MSVVKRIFLFFVINALVVITLSLVLNILNVRPYLTQHGIDYRALMIFCLIWGMGGALISLAMSRIMAKWLMGVKIIDENTNDPQLKSLVALVHRLARQANLPAMPQVGIYEAREVNAFATGPTQRRSLVAVSRGLLDKMSIDEVEGVLAHEISHVANGDMVTMTLLQGIVNAFVMFLARVLAAIFSGMGRNKEDSRGGSFGSYMLMVFLFEVVFMVLGSMVIAAYSRFREFRADAGGAGLAGKQKMIAALESLQNTQKLLPDAASEKAAFQAFKISTRGKTGFLALFATHPPLEQRIERLHKL
ncbi:MAG: protease HtpX [Chlamydiales bacterium]|nr:protease HtpX [Chlamydiales bacterium]